MFDGRRRRETELEGRLVAALDALSRHESEPLYARVGESVLVHLDSRQSVAGILDAVHEKSLVLRAARLLVEGSGAIAMDGDQHVIPRSKVTIVNVGVVIDDARLPS